jgi:uncharacterized protein YgiM (DUF1202 family)
MIRTTILVAAAFTAFAAPALAESVACTVTAPEIRLRKSQSKKARVLAVLKKDDRATAEGKCSGGWVKITSEDGRLSGYVAGWALAEATPKVAAPSVAPADVQVASVEAAPPVTAVKEIPNNEQLAIQITDLRLKVLGLDRDVEKIKKDIQKIKASVRRVTGKKGHKGPAKKG